MRRAIGLLCRRIQVEVLFSRAGFENNNWVQLHHGGESHSHLRTDPPPPDASLSAEKRRGIIYSAVSLPGQTQASCFLQHLVSFNTMGATYEDSSPALPAWNVIEFTFSENDTHSELVVMCAYHRFIISLSADNFSPSSILRNKYLYFLKVAENYELDGYTIDDFHDWIVEPLLPIFRELPEVGTDLTLQDFLFPKTHLYTLRAEGDNLAATPLEGEDVTEPIFGVHLSDDICGHWPLFKPREVQLCAKMKLPGPPSNTPSKVLLADGSIAFPKLIRSGDKNSLMNEISTYERIQAAGLHETLHIPRLLGLARDDHGQVFALLLSYIQCGRKTLLCASKKGTSRRLKQKWALQITNAVEQLHRAGIVWGDVKPDNVLVDHNEDAWLIDFGGGYTEGWVPRELRGSIQGDSKGLEKIIEFLSTD